MRFQLDTEKKPLFTPDPLINGLGCGVLFNTYGRVYLFVGTIKIGASEYSALAVSDHSEGKFRQAIENHSDYSVASGDFVAVDDEYFYSKEQDTRFPVFALYNPQAIQNMFYHLHKDKNFTLSKKLLDLEDKVTIAGPRPF